MVKRGWVISNSFSIYLFHLFVDDEGLFELELLFLDSMVALVVEVAFEVSVKLVDEVNHVDYSDAHWLCTIIK